MTTPTNWPDPTRVGFPMFPYQDGKHVFEMELYPGFVVWKWSAKNKEYSGISYEAEIVYSPEEMAREYKYFGPALTPVQINEMLAEERKRCITACESATVAADGWGDPIDDGDADRNEGIEDAIAAIRNLGDAP